MLELVAINKLQLGDIFWLVDKTVLCYVFKQRGTLKSGSGVHSFIDVYVCMVQSIYLISSVSTATVTRVFVTYAGFLCDKPPLLRPQTKSTLCSK